MAGSQPGLIREARSIWSELRGVAEDRVRLAVLETRVAGESLARMVAAGIFAALLAITAWLAIVGAIVLALIQAGLPAIAALLLAAAASIGAAVGLYFFIKGLSRNLTFPATLDAFRRKDPEVVAPRREGD